MKDYKLQSYRIILEGPDSGGKTTLGKYLGKVLNLPVVKFPGKPQFHASFSDRLDFYFLQNTPMIFDRHSVISELVYQKVFNRIPLIPKFGMDYLIRLFLEQTILVFCSPSLSELLLKKDPDFKKDHDGADEKEMKEKIYNTYIKLFTKLEEDESLIENQLIVISYNYLLDKEEDIANECRRRTKNFKEPKQIKSHF